MWKYVAIIGLTLLSGMSTARAEPNEDRVYDLHRACEAGDRRACVWFGIEIGRHQERAAEWHRSHPDWYWYEH